MAQTNTLPLYVNDPIIDSYDLPLIGKVEIRQFVDSEKYYVLVSGIQFNVPEDKTDLTEIKKSLEILVFNLADKKHKNAEKEFEKAKQEFNKTDVPYSEIISLIRKYSKREESWLDNYPGKGEE